MDPLYIIIGFVSGLAASVAAILYFKSGARADDSRLAEKERTISAQQQELLELNKRNAELEATLRLEREAAGEKLKLLEEAKERLRIEFQNLANRIFEEKGQQLSGSHREQLKTILEPLREQLGKFREKVESAYETEGKERASLQREIRLLTEMNRRISDEAGNLAKALKGESKTRGNWGEMILERVLEQSGLVNGREYETQVHLREKYGGQQGRFPDVIVHLPEERDVVIDAKVALNAYERHVNAEDPAEREAALKDHIAAVRNHMRGLSAKDYASLDGINAMELVLMCVPNESAFVAAVSADPSLHDEAMKNRVVMVSPTTLLLTLKIIESMWRTERQNLNAMKIAERGQLLYDKFVGFVEDLQKVSAAIGKSQEACGDAMKKLSDGSGNLVRQAEMLRELGVKTSKRLPAGLAEDAAAPSAEA